ncbi:hypothetical protein H072_8606 [Dactylellina haptotyla CBS 200.50]|uniref:Ubiquitin-like protease family profile domain-containing protein n=1 Tax=Dactylellina haptotyla (strain CBS 200.50) TaxID=1284197 RepID=S8BEN6_DACHA|nr:hypothetical protein H072_8606 [Dactylellina haptotyla CBS 200.50]
MLTERLGKIESVIEGLTASISSVMPLNGDKEDLESQDSPTGQNGPQHPKSSPKKTEGAESSARYAQEWKGHKSGNPPGAHLIVPRGSYGPRNNLYPSKHTHNDTQPVKRRPGQGQPNLQFAHKDLSGRDRVGGSSESRHRNKGITIGYKDDTTVIEDDSRAYEREDRTKVYSDEISTRVERGSRRRSSLSGQDFKNVEEDNELMRGIELESPLGSPVEPRRTKRKVTPFVRANQRAESTTWDIRSNDDPSPTTFTKKNKPLSSPPTHGTRSKREGHRSDTTIILKAAYRGPVGAVGLKTVVRRTPESIYVFEGGSQLTQFDISFENIKFAAYTDDEKHHNSVILKLRSRQNSLDSTVIYHFRAIADPPTKPISERDAMVFVGWMFDKEIDVQSKESRFFDKCLEDNGNYSVASAPIMKLSSTSSVNTDQRQSDRGNSTPKPRPQDNRKRPQAPIDLLEENVPQPYTPLLDMAGQGTGFITGTESRPVRRSTRSNPAKPATPIQIPEPHPTQIWKESLRFPFVDRPAETLDCSNLRLLDADQFLNDEVINFHLAIIRKRLKRDNPELAAKVHIFNTYLYTAFSTPTDNGKFNYDKVRRWTKDDIFQKDLVFIPVNEKYHWFLAVVCNLPAALASAKARDDLLCIESGPNPRPSPRKGGKVPVAVDRCAVIILDSMNGMHNTTLKGIKHFLTSECVEKKKVELRPEDITGLSPRKIPGQDNFSDCGVFMLHYIEKWLENPQIKNALYVRDLGTQEEARSLWKVSEVVDKRDNMWKSYVKLKEEHDKFLRGEPFTEFPEIDDVAAIESHPKAADSGDIMPVDKGSEAMAKLTDPEQEDIIQRVPSPAKKRSSEHDDVLSAKRPKSASPGIETHSKKPKSDELDENTMSSHLPAAPGLRHTSPEIPDSEEMELETEKPEQPATESSMELENSDVPLIAANGLVDPLGASRGLRTVHDTETSEGSKDVFRGSNFAVVVDSQDLPNQDSRGINTPSIDAASSFSDGTIDGNEEKKIESQRDEIVDPDGDITMSDFRPRARNEDIEDSEDDSHANVRELSYGGKVKPRGKSLNELAYDQIIDDNSSQGPQVPKTPTGQRGNGNTVHDPIVLDSQTSPKRPGLRSSPNTVSK